MGTGAMCVDRVVCITFAGFDITEASCSREPVSCKAARRQQLPSAADPRGCWGLCWGLQRSCLICGLGRAVTALSGEGIALALPLAASPPQAETVVTVLLRVPGV